MNRPYWLEILYVNGFVIPPIAVAAAVTTALARRQEWSGPVWLLAYLVASAMSLVLWLAGLIMWSRRSSGPSHGSNGDPE